MVPARAQEPPAQPAAPQERRDPTPEPRPYDRVITKEARSDEGIFTVHRIGDRLLYEIPKTALDTQFLWVSQIARTTLGVGWGGQAAGNRVVRWERRGNRVFLRNVSHDVTADSAQPIANAVRAANNDTILMAFNIEAFGKDDAPVIDVTRLFTTEVPEFSARSRVRSRNFDTNRSFVERAVSFPENIEVEATHTFSSPPELQNQQPPGPPTPGQAQNAIRPGSASVVMHYSMVKLPEKPMMPRLFDERVGYFSASQMDYGQDEHRAPQRRYITRWRLEKTDPNAALSEPVKPIVYDTWATMWGYKPIPGARTPDDEKKTLDEWARQQDATPWLRFSTSDSRGSDPGELTEAVGDADAVKSTTLGLKNLERVSNMLMTATKKAGEPFDDLEELYGRLLGQWALEMNHVAAIVGGFQSQQRHWGQNGVRFTAIPAARQAGAVSFLNAHAFETPSFVVKPEILRRIEPTGALDRIKASQLRVLNQLTNNARIARLIEQEAIDGEAAYKPTVFFADLRKGIWRELEAPSVKVDPFRRNTQRAYLEVMGDKLNGRTAPVDDTRGLVRAELRAVDASARRALVKATDRATRVHLEDVRDQIAKILDPKFAAPATAPGGGGQGQGPQGLDVIESCWPDTAVRLEVKP